MVIVFSFVTIKVKSKRNKKEVLNISNAKEEKLIMSEGISTIVNHKPEVFFNYKTLSVSNKNSNSSNRSKKVNIYAVYNPDSNPNFYLHNKLNWYKNFD
jgi:glutamine cyclotransferase